MHSTAVQIKRLGLVTIRPLRDGGLAAYVDGAAEPAAVGRISRSRIDVAVADGYPSRVADPLVERLAADARAANVTLGRSAQETRSGFAARLTVRFRRFHRGRRPLIRTFSKTA